MFRKPIPTHQFFPDSAVADRRLAAARRRALAAVAATLFCATASVLVGRDAGVWTVTANAASILSGILSCVAFASFYAASSSLRRRMFQPVLRVDGVGVQTLFMYTSWTSLAHVEHTAAGMFRFVRKDGQVQTADLAKWMSVDGIAAAAAALRSVGARLSVPVVTTMEASAL